LDVSKTQAELGFTATSVETWTEELARWYSNVRNGSDSPGYANRQAEIEFAQRYRRATDHLLDSGS